MRRLALLVLSALLVTGCASQPDSPNGGSMEDQTTTLQQRPTMAEITTRYEEMQQKIRDRFTAELGLAPWIDDGNPGQAGCGEFPDVQDAEKHTLNRWLHEGSIPDDQWPRALQIADEVASEYGFVERQVILDRPGDHKVEIRDAFGGWLQLGTKVNTVMQVRTGCHLV
ncbi:Lipoprotein [Saccharopolyspora kobensis]|uniref:Lipoprotein n=1 Tax=Saccharopolyspora kobensis TaxID=146035 RepID=A0A1H6CYE1_9PSEU|nr:LppA family lipoprotein [Saccharopolyspora kobensis]SEG78090.1 Lipoprotein [Saccharopolyspora kobensis]SFD04484.1 Lipoprotein [Saccharopolyspora kobensis]